MTDTNTLNGDAPAHDARIATLTADLEVRDARLAELSVQLEAGDLALLPEWQLERSASDESRIRLWRLSHGYPEVEPAR